MTSMSESLDRVGNFLGARGRFGLEVKRRGHACLWWLWRWVLGAQGAVVLSAAPSVVLATCTCLLRREGYGSTMMWLMARLLGYGFRSPNVLSARRGGGEGWIPQKPKENFDFHMFCTKTLGNTQCPYSARTVPVVNSYSARTSFRKRRV